MRRPFKTPLYLKLLIATIVWLLFFGFIYWIVSFFNPINTVNIVIWCWALLIWGFNIIILFVTHNREHKDSANKAKDHKLKNNEPWAI